MFTDEIKKVPLGNDPEMMGLQKNAIAYYHLEESNYVCETFARIHKENDRNDKFFSSSGFHADGIPKV